LYPHSLQHSHPLAGQVYSTANICTAGERSQLLKEQNANEIGDKDWLVDTLTAAMKQAASGELTVECKPKQPWISQDTLLRRKGTTTDQVIDSWRYSWNSCQ